MEALNIIVTVVTLLVSLGAIITFVVDRKRGHEQNGAEEESIRSDIRYMRNSMDEMRLDVRSIIRTQGEHSERITRIEESCKQAHKRIDHIEDHIDLNK